MELPLTFLIVGLVILAGLHRVCLLIERRKLKEPVTKPIESKMPEGERWIESNRFTHRRYYEKLTAVERVGFKMLKVMRPGDSIPKLLRVEDVRQEDAGRFVDILNSFPAEHVWEDGTPATPPTSL